MTDVHIIEDMIGKTFVKVEVDKDVDTVRFFSNEQEGVMFYHEQDCCETVTVEDVIGDLDDLVGSPIIMAEEVTEEGSDDYDYFTHTWYKFATVKGYVTIRWYGTSNGYYSERVDYCSFYKGVIR